MRAKNLCCRSENANLAISSRADVLRSHRFRANEIYLELNVLADTLGNLRRLKLPHRIKNWSLPNLRDRLLQTGGRLLRRASSNSGPDKSEHRERERRPASDSLEVFWFDDDEVRLEASARVVDTTADGFGLVTADPLPVGRTVWLISLACDERKVVVRHCSPLADEWKSGVYWVKSERRRTDRWPVSGSATLTWTGDGKRHEAVVEMMDITESGARVDSPVAILMGATCQISGLEFRCEGHVCSQVSAPKDRYRIGIEFYRSSIFRF